jgi:hypothetical protein
MIKLIKFIPRLIKIQQNKIVKAAAKNTCYKCGRMNKKKSINNKKILSISSRINSHTANIINNKIQMRYNYNKFLKNQIRIRIKVKIINSECIKHQNSQ